MAATEGMTQRRPAQAGEMVFVFKNVTPGIVAVASAHDENDNGKTDTNFLGIPREDWGVSNNARPNLRAPRFDEAQFELTADTTIEIRLN